MNTDTKSYSSDIDDRIAKLTTIVEQLVSTMGQDRERYDKLMVEISWIQSWTKQTHHRALSFSLGISCRPTVLGEYGNANSEQL